MLQKAVSCLSRDALLELWTAVYLANVGLFGVSVMSCLQSVLQARVRMSTKTINSKMSHVFPPYALQLHQQAKETLAAARGTSHLTV